MFTHEIGKPEWPDDLDPICCGRKDVWRQSHETSDNRIVQSWVAGCRSHHQIAKTLICGCRSTCLGVSAQGRPTLCQLHESAEIMLAALKRAHACATIRPSGECDGCYVMDAIRAAEGRSKAYEATQSTHGDNHYPGCGHDLVRDW